MQIQRPETQSDLFKVVDFATGARQFYIKEVEYRTFDFNSGPEDAYVVHFHDENKQLKLGKKNLTCLIDMYGDDSDTWINQLVTLQQERLSQPFNGSSHRLAVVYQQALATPPEATTPPAVATPPAAATPLAAAPPPPPPPPPAT